jgi:trigger factor
MANIERHNIDDLNLSVAVTLTKEELSAKFKSELNRFAQRAAVKGFRKGKTPVSYIKKMYGGEIFSEIVNEMISSNVSNFMQENKLDLLGQPIPSEEKFDNDFGMDNIQDLKFSFDMGLAPQFELQGLTTDSKFSKYIPEIPTKWIEEAFEADRNRVGERATIDGGDLQEKDMIKLDVKEVDGSVEANITVLFDDLSDDLKTAFATKKVGETLTFDIYKIEKDADENRVRKYILGLEEGVTFGADFEGTISEITRIGAAEMNEAFFTKAYGETVTNEAQAREFLVGEFSKYMVGDTWGLLLRDLQEHLIQANPMNLPDIFLKRWLAFSNEKNTPELVERDYARFSNNLRWTMIRDQIIEKHNVQLHDEDIMAVYKDRVRSSYGAQLGDEFLDYFAQRMMEEGLKKKSKEHDDVVESAMFDKVFRVVAAQVDVVDTHISWDEFDAKRAAAIATAKESRAGEAVEINDVFEDAEVVA